MTRTIGLILLLRWDDSTAREISDILINVESVILAKDMANYTLEGIACFGNALMDAAVQPACNGCNIVECVGKSIGWAHRTNINAALAPATYLRLVEGYLRPLASYPTPFEMSAGKAAKTQ